MFGSSWSSCERFGIGARIEELGVVGGTYKGLPLVHFSCLEEWVGWLDESHSVVSGVWVKFAKKGSACSSLSYEEAREGALIYGWIDGLINAFDADFYVTRFTPRRPKGNWSRVNRGIVEGLIREGRMHPAGLREVDAAQRDGRWDAAYDSQRAATSPPDFQQALEDSPAALEFFKSISSANRYAFLYRIQTSTNPQMRAKRIAAFVAMLESGKTFH